MTITTLAYPEVYEGGSGTPLVLLHGFGGSWRQWIPVLKQLEAHHRVIAPTLPGHIGGLPMTERATPVTISNALAKQLRERGIANAHFVGQSLGGWAIWEMVRHGLARSALGFSPAGAWRDEREKAEFMRKGRETFRMLPYFLPLMLQLMRVPALRKRLLSGEMQNGDRVPYEILRDGFMRISKMTIIHEYLDPDLPPMKPLPADSTAALRVVWCEKDTTLPFEIYGQPLLDLLGLKTHGVLAGCGHNPLYDNTEGVVKAILDFTRAVESGKPL